ncbi:MAG TPA: M1 family aminopeptidase [Phycisphaerae bacterium]|nr:M1 family aminopeptidase [Phycisphaerae bacterium]HRW51689.1 M1 family aminopeptidase [Phycisphaerae bacterium]
MIVQLLLLSAGLAPAVRLTACPLIAQGPEGTAQVVQQNDGEIPGEANKPGCGHARQARPDLFSWGPGPGSRGATDNTDILHYRLEIEILPQIDNGGAITAVRVHGVNHVDAEVVNSPTSQFELDLIDTLTVINVTGDVSNWSHANGRITISLDRAYAPGEPIHVDVEYDGEPETAGLGAFKWWIRNGNLSIATLSEPYYSPFWWPCKDSLNDKSTMQVIVTVPDPLVAVSNGVLQETTQLSGNRTRYSWRESHPMANYLASLAITNYKRYDLTYEYDDGGGGTSSMPVPCYLYAEHWSIASGQPYSAYRQGCDEMLDMLAVFEEKFGPYAFRSEKYGVAETGGANGLQSNMEHQTISSMYTVEAYSRIMAHEMAHQWFGDDVTCGTWNDIWLNEGITTYAESVYFEFAPSGGVDDYWSRIRASKPTSPDNRVYRTNIDSTDAIFSTNDVYRKGAWVCHMLRHMIGDEAFFRALSDYRAAYSGGFATTADFAAGISSSFGHDLTWFIDQWVMNPGAPDYRWNYATGIANGQRYVRIGISQAQVQEGFGLFIMPIDIRLTTTTGVFEFTVWNDDWTEYYVLPIEGQLTAIEIDEFGGVNNRNYVLTSSLAFGGGFPESPPALLDVAVHPYLNDAVESTIDLKFSSNIGDFDTADFTLVGAATGLHLATSVVYGAAAQTATLTFTDLPNDAFTLTVFDDDVIANGKLLDGEIDDSAWYDDTLLPSGDGQPGGDAVVTFDIPAGDANCDAAVDLDDLSAFTAVLLGADTTHCHLLRCDVNNDGQADGLDIAGFIDAVMVP